MSSDTLLAFSLATLALLLLPGPAVMYIVTRSATQGRRAGFVSVAGIHVGTVVHVVAAMIGLSAIIAASATAFTAVKLAGAAYLIWLGIDAIRSARAGRSIELPSGPESRPLDRVFWDGVVLNILNPKTAMFFLAFVPQFVDASSATPVLDVALLGGVFIVLGLVSDGAYAFVGGWVGERLRRSPRLQRSKDFVAGGAYLGLGAVTALTGNRTA